MATKFNGRLNTNEFYNSIYNAARLYMIYADNLKGMDNKNLAEKYRADGGMYNDQSVFTDMDVIYSRIWDPNDTNVLAPEAVVKPVQEKITVNQFRQIGIYTDEYLSKRAWMDPNTYDEFRSVVQKQSAETKRVYEQRLVDVFVGVEPSAASQTITLTLPTDTDAEKQNRLQAQAIAKKIGDLFVDLKDTTTDFNVNGFIKSFDKGDIDVIWNADYYNKIRYVDLPTIFHKEDLLENGIVLPSRYFGTRSTITGDAHADGTGKYRAEMEAFIPVDATGKYSANGTNVVHVFPGDVLPNLTPISSEGTADYFTKEFTVNGVKRTIQYYTDVRAYQVDPKIICKLVHKDAVKYMSSFETATEFWNPKNLTTNRYLTWAYAKPQLLNGYPFITLVAG
ncbi:MAG: hypothetical protein MR906_07195 [Clostridium sp.]|nr:hypothetical protein [Clostridium sp.]